MAYNAFSTLMPGEDNWMRGQPMPGQAPQMGTPAAPAMTGQPQKPRPLMNAFSKIFEIGAPEAFEAGRQKKLTQNLGNALAGGDYSGAAEMALRGGQLEQGLKLRGEAETRQQAQMAEQRKAEAQGTYQLFNSMQPAQINDYAMQDPVGFERMTGMSSEEYLQAAQQFQRVGMSPDQFRQFVIEKAQAELGIKPETPEPYTLAPGARRYDSQGNMIAENPVAQKENLPAGMRMGPNGPEWIPGYLEGQERLRSSGASRINVSTGANGPEIGTIPQGFAAVRDPNNPSGFRMEAIPGGPAGIEAQGAATAKSALDNTFDGIMQSYLDLQDKGAIRDTEATTGENISAFLKSSPPGRLIGKATGSEAESLRETIEALQPSITQAIMSQPGMSARSMDSQRELEFFMKSITTPTADVWANFTTLHALDKRFGSGQLMNRMLQQGRITADDYARITRSPRVNDIINRVDSKIGELFVMDGQGSQPPAQNDGLPPGFVVIE